MPEPKTEPNTSEPSNPRKNQAQRQQDDGLKLIALMGIGLSAILMMAIFAPQALYGLIGAVSLATFAIYPQIEINHVLWGAGFGLIFIGGPIGLIIGGGLGHFLGKKLEQFMRWVDPIVKATAPFAGAAAAVTIQILKGPTNLMGLTNNAVGRISNATTSMISSLQSTMTSISGAVSNATSAGINALATTNPNVIPAEISKEESLIDAVLNDQPKMLQFLTDNTKADIIGTKANTTAPAKKAENAVSTEEHANQNKARRPRRGQRIGAGFTLL